MDKDGFPDMEDSAENSVNGLDNKYSKIPEENDIKQINRSERKYWLYAAGENSRKWEEFYRDGIMAIGWEYLGNLTEYHSQEEMANKIKEYESRNKYPMNDSKTNWDFVKNIRIGDIIYARKGRQNLIGRGVVKSGYVYDEKRNEYNSIRKVEWTHNGTYNVDFNELDRTQWAQKTLTEISQSEFLKLEDLFVNNHRNKKRIHIPLNQILYGPPGTGKTYNTVIKAMEIINKDCMEYDENGNIINYSNIKQEFDRLKQEGQIEFVTFHQSYSYEEFVEGIKPDILEWEENSEKLNYIGRNGIFKQICNKAENDLYTVNKDEEIDFDKAYKLFQEKYEAGSNLLNLKNIQYEPNNLVYHFGNQVGDRRIALDKIKEIFNANKKYTTALEFNKDYKGNNPLKGYFFNFYKELVKIKEDCDKENQNKNVINQNMNNYVLIIDEINRGNISKIFGELITLIEEDKRLGNDGALAVTLPYSNHLFGIPKNLYIIGTMNTSDRSIASIDIALRRRFKFIEMMPKKELVADFRIGFADIFENINNKIKVLLDRDHQIGHSYFINTKYNDENGNNDIDTLKDIWFSEILPLLNEYFYCDWEKLQLIIPGFIKKSDIPEPLKNECEDAGYEFKTQDEIENFESAIKQENFNK